MTTTTSALSEQVAGDHYKKLGIFQPWSVFAYWLTPEELRGYCKGTVMAYLARERDKGGLTDISKSAHTIGLFEELLPICEAFHKKADKPSPDVNKDASYNFAGDALHDVDQDSGPASNPASNLTLRPNTPLPTWAGRFVADFNTLKKEVHENAKAHGWWDEACNDGEMIALMHSELSEALEVLRNDRRAMDDKIKSMPALVVELADVVIRIMDFTAHYNLPLAHAILEKHIYNVGRPYKHGGKKF